MIDLLDWDQLFMLFGCYIYIYIYSKCSMFSTLYFYVRNLLI